jgi:hypothetical protein
MKLRDRLVIKAGNSIGLNLTYSNNHGGWSRGLPYTKSDIEFSPLHVLDDAFELAEKLGIDIPIGTKALTKKKAMLFVVITAANSTT